jgi:hypothetical protein
MSRPRRSQRPPLDVRREFTNGRLEKQVLARTYELVLSLIRTPTRTATTADRPAFEKHVKEA